jgi:hypothetical protein
MSEEKFFLQVKSTMEHYAPEVPAAVYAGMRRKLWVSQFMRWNASRLNAWYVLLFVSLGTTAAVLASNNGAQGTKAAQFSAPVEATITPAAQVAVTGNVAPASSVNPLNETTVADCSKNCMFSPKNIRPEETATMAPSEQAVTNEDPVVSVTHESTPEVAATQQATETPTSQTESEQKPVNTKKKRTLRPAVYTNGN